MFIKHIKYETPSQSTVAASITTNEQSTTQKAEESSEKTDTESIPFNHMFTRKESDNEFIDRKRVDAEEEELKQLYERGDGGAADGEDVTTGLKFTQATENPLNRNSCLSKLPSHSIYNSCPYLHTHLETCNIIFN